MTDRRMQGILKQIAEKYEDVEPECTRQMLIDKAISATLRGLQRTEGFLGNVEVYHDERIIMFGSEEDYRFLMFLPYLHKELFGNTDMSKIYLCYYPERAFEEAIYLKEGLCFIDNEHQLTIHKYPARSLGIFDTRNDRFINGFGIN